MPHQLRCQEGGGLGAELAPPWPLLPVSPEAAGVFLRDRGLHRCCVVPLANGFVVGEGHVAHIQHVLQQGDGVHGQVAERVLHRPAVGVLLQCRHQRQLPGICAVRGAHPHKQQPLSAGGRQAGAAGAPTVRLGVLQGLGDQTTLALTVETPTVVRAFELTCLVDAPLTQGNEPMGADVGKDAPAVLHAVPPDDQIALQQGEAIGPLRIQIRQVADRPPLLCPGGMHRLAEQWGHDRQVCSSPRPSCRALHRLSFSRNSRPSRIC